MIRTLKVANRGRAAKKLMRAKEALQRLEGGGRADTRIGTGAI